MSTLGLGVWTLGNHARRNLVPAVMESPSWELRGVTSRNASVVTEIASQTSAKAYVDPEAMLSDTSIDAVLIAGPNGVHYEQAKRVLLSGKHVFVEKSLTANLEHAEELAEIARASKRVIAECFMYRFHPQFQALLAIVRDSALTGEVHTITARFGFPHLPAGDTRYSKALAGGALLDVGAYCVSAQLSLLGPNPGVEWARVEHPGHFEIDTGGSAIFRSGTRIGHADWGFGRAYRNEIEVWAERVTVTASRVFSKPPTLDTEIVIVHQEDNRRESRRIPAANHFVAMLESFAQACSSASMRDALATEALHQARTMRVIRDRSNLRS